MLLRKIDVLCTIGLQEVLGYWDYYSMRSQECEIEIDVHTHLTRRNGNVGYEYVSSGVLNV